MGVAATLPGGSERKRHLRSAPSPRFPARDGAWTRQPLRVSAASSRPRDFDAGAFRVADAEASHVERNTANFSNSRSRRSRPSPSAAAADPCTRASRSASARNARKSPRRTARRHPRARAFSAWRAVGCRTCSVGAARVSSRIPRVPRRSSPRTSRRARVESGDGGSRALCAGSGAALLPTTTDSSPPRAYWRGAVGVRPSTPPRTVRPPEACVTFALVRGRGADQAFEPSMSQALMAKSATNQTVEVPRSPRQTVRRRRARFAPRWTTPAYSASTSPRCTRTARERPRGSHRGGRRRRRVCVGQTLKNTASGLCTTSTNAARRRSC